MRNENIETQELEKLLKNKMDELSESVDCFDKISARAFSQDKPDFSESGFTVSDLETITPRRKAPAVIRWTAIAAAAAIGIAVIPKTGFIPRVFYNISSSSSVRSYQELIEEISSETENGSYNIFDVPLDYYIKNDVLVTPLFSCPFEDCGISDANVRIFIKQFDCLSLTQVYAIEYTGEFSENNFVAAAESKYKFTDEELEIGRNITASLFGYRSSSETVECCFTVDQNGSLVDLDGKKLKSLASFDQLMLYKDAATTAFICASVLYGQKLNESGCFYDICAYTSDNDTISLTDRKDMWKRSVYYNGKSAMPDDDHSDFTRTELFGSDENGDTANIIAIKPYSEFDLTTADHIYSSDNVTISSGGTSTAPCEAPYDPAAKSSMKVYLPVNDDFNSRSVINVVSYEIGMLGRFDVSDIDYDIILNVDTGDGAQSAIWNLLTQQKNAYRLHIFEQEMKRQEEMDRNRSKAEEELYLNMIESQKNRMSELDADSEEYAKAETQLNKLERQLEAIQK